MKNGAVIILLGCALLMLGNGATANGSPSAGHEYTGQVCNVGNDAVCSAVTDELLKEVIKQTIYTVGNQIINKYSNSQNQPQTVVPQQAPDTTTYTTVQTVAPAADSTTSAAPAEDMIIIQ
ncbi:MAG: hypothetical protein GX568_02925 [Candidatus Gastranaerophilales bacterium]|nr:hypothetical protein [Candidatus Gastranaerophilales bacterium]